MALDTLKMHKPLKYVKKIYCTLFHEMSKTCNIHYFISTSGQVQIVKIKTYKIISLTFQFDMFELRNILSAKMSLFHVMNQLTERLIVQNFFSFKPKRLTDLQALSINGTKLNLKSLNQN